MNRGDIVRVDLPRPRGTPGREQFGLRPAIVVQDEPRLADLSTVLVVPLTSNQAASRFPGSLRIAPTKENGLSVESIALTQQVRAIDRSRVQDTLGEISCEDAMLLDDQLRALLRI